MAADERAVPGEEVSGDKRSLWERLGIDPWETRSPACAKRLNLGAGDRPDPLWTNHSKGKHRPEIDVAWDLNQTPWPWPSNTFSRVNAWAVLEHLRLDLVESMDEIWRILRPIGKVHIKVPRHMTDRAYTDPTHHWRGWHPKAFTFFDPTTRRGRECSYYTPYKWDLLDWEWTNKQQVAFAVSLRKVCSLEQWEQAMGEGARAVESKRIIWINGRSNAGKSTLVRYLQTLFPQLVVVDDHDFWHGVWKYTYAKLNLEKTAEFGVDWFKDERRESTHRDFAIEVALTAKALAKQGHRVLVSMIASPQKRRERIMEILDNPYHIYLKHKQGEEKKPYFDTPKKGEYDLLIDGDELNALGCAAKCAKHLAKEGLLT